MASARCYTKSGSVEKYESNLWKSPTAANWSSAGILGNITTPDSNGNYTVTPEQHFEDSSDTTTYSCFTEYGGVKKTFYFKEKNSTVNGKMTLSLFGRNSINGNKIVFGCNVSASPSFTGANFRLTLAFDYYEHDLSGNLSGSYTKMLSFTITSSSDSFSDEVNLHVNGGSLHSYSLRNALPSRTNINNIVYEITIEGSHG